MSEMYIYTMEYYSAIKKNEIMPFAGKWKELEIIMLRKVSQTQKDKYCMVSLICTIKISLQKNKGHDHKRGIIGEGTRERWGRGKKG
jgi:hypothetical protein